MATFPKNPSPQEAGSHFSESGGDGEVFLFPASCAQQRFWMLDQLEQGNPAYNVAVRFRLEGPLHVPTLERAFNEIIRRHEVLRTTLTAKNGEPMQVIASSLTIRVPCIDLRWLPEAQRHDEVEKFVVAEARVPFDLQIGPLLRVSLLHIADEEHMLLITIHHAICDGWSIGVITDELAAIYDAFARGQAHTLPDLPLQYADFTLWQRDAFESAAIEKQTDYWREKLRGAADLNLLADHPRPAVQSFNGNIVSTLLPKPLTNALHELSARENVTLFTVMLAAFDVLLHRYTRQDDIIVGSPIAGRNRVEIEPLIGVFINTLTLRNDLSGDPTFCELLTRVRETVLGAVANQDLPFEKIVEELRPARDAGRNPFFQINFTYQRDFIKPVEFAGVRLTAIPSKSPGSLFDLNFFMVERAEGWRASCEHNTDLFDEATAKRMLAHLVKLLEAIAENPRQKISQYCFVGDAERRQLLVDWNATRADYPRDKTIAQVFAEQAQRTPDAIALDFADKILTYRQLDAESNRLAHFLQKRGVGPDVIVGVLMERSASMIVAMLGILKVGGAYLPMDTAYPPARIAFILNDAKPALTLTQSGLAAKLPDGAAAVRLDVESFADENDIAPESAATAESLAYVMFTSGSTGEPKGVAVPQRAVNRLVLNTNYVSFAADDVVAHASNAAFDAATLEVWGALLNGSRLAGISSSMSPRDFAGQLRARGVTTMFLTTALFNQIARAESGAFATLRTVIFGGENGDPAATREIFKHGKPPQRLVNGYGPTETTTFATWHLVTDKDERCIPIGRPITNTEIYLLDERQQPAPVGVPGEIYIGGDGLARGYLNRPELTAQRFVKHPFRDGERLYRSGDLARYLADGSIEFLGRIDQQVKLRGFRIELGEIEAVLARHEAVRARVVVARDDGAAGKRLVAYVVPAAGRKTDTAEMRDFLKTELPECMVPAAIVLLDALPVTPNGKVDVAALPEPEQRTETSARRAPRSATERDLAELWAEVLGRTTVGIEDNFFDIGGHSLLALSLFARMESRFGKSLPLATLFKAPTVAALAQLLDAKTMPDTAEPSSLVAVQPEGSKPPFFCIHGGDGGILFYRDLGARFETGRPVFALEAPWLNREAKTHETIEEIAAAYIRDVRAAQPHGPYHLGGFSLGGVVAFEMAQQLAAAGERVGVLTLFDTFNPLVPPRRYTLIERVIANWRMSASLPWSKKIAQLLRRAKEKTEIKRKMREELAEQARAEKLSAFGEAVPTELRHLLARKAHVRAMKVYQPKPFDGSMLLFTARDRFEGYYLRETLGWENLVRGGLHICCVPGSHDSILKDPNVQTLVGQLQTFLDAADQHA